MQAQKIQEIRTRSSKINNDLIRLQTKRDDAAQRRQTLIDEAQKKYGVSSLKELREKARAQRLEENQVISEIDRQLSAAEAVINQVHQELNNLNSGGQQGNSGGQ